MECTSIKFELFWRKIIRKDGCKGVSETALIIALGIAIHYRARKEEWRIYFDPV